jgi:4-amino-4-deoxy-L-arabinose transferase-like glycosyltransferase
MEIQKGIAMTDQRGNLRVDNVSLVSLLREERWMLLLFCLALVIRAVYVMPQVEIPKINDMGVYDQLATNLLSGNGYISQLEPHFRAWRAPGYPFFLLVIYFIFGHHALPVLLLQSLLGALTCVMIYLIGRRIFSRKIGIIAGFICAVDPEMIHWTAKMLTETLFIFLLALLVLLCLRLTESRRWFLPTIGAGLVLGYATLVRPNILLLIPFLISYFLFFVQVPVRNRMVLAGIPPIVCALVILPWTVRNYLVLGKFVPVASIGGVSLFVGIPPTDKMVQEAEFDGLEQWKSLKDWEYLDWGMHVLPNGYSMLPELLGQTPPYQLPADFDELEQSQLGYSRFFEYVREDPVRYGKLLLTKLSLTFSVVPKQYRADLHEDYGLGRFDSIARQYSMLFLIVTFVLGPLGLIVTFRKQGPTILLNSVLLYHIVMQLVFRPTLRYFLPGLVIASLFTANGLETLSRKSLLSSMHSNTLVRLRVWGGSVVLFAFNTFYQIFILRWDMVIRYWNHLLAILVKRSI